jgi:hypothetical protein
VDRSHIADGTSDPIDRVDKYCGGRTEACKNHNRRRHDTNRHQLLPPVTPLFFNLLRA